MALYLLIFLSFFKGSSILFLRSLLDSGLSGRLIILLVFQMLNESLLYRPLVTNNSFREEGRGFSPFNRPWFNSSAETSNPTLSNSKK